MALYFMLASKSYLQSFKEKDKTGALRRQAILAKYLNQKYKDNNIVSDIPKIIAECEAEGVVNTPSIIRNDIVMLRLAYRYFKEDKMAVLRRMENKHDFAIKAVRCLITDGFETWEQVVAKAEEMLSQEEESTSKSSCDTEGEVVATGEEKNVIIPAEESTEIESSITEMFEWTVKTKKELAEVKKTLTDKDAENASLRSRLGSMELENEQKDKEIVKLIRESKSDSQKENELEVLRFKLEETKALLDMSEIEMMELEFEINSLKKQLELSDYALLAIAEVRKLLDDCVPKEEIEKLSLDEDDKNDPSICLPEECAKLGKPFLYSKGFRKTFGEIGRRKQLIIAKSLEFFANNGPGYGSLKSKKHNYSGLDEGEMASHGGRLMRFFWDIKDNVVHVTGLRKKKDLVKS